MYIHAYIDIIINLDTDTNTYTHYIYIYIYLDRDLLHRGIQGEINEQIDKQIK